MTEFVEKHECMWVHMKNEWIALMDHPRYNGKLSLCDIFAALPKCQHLVKEEKDIEEFCMMVPVWEPRLAQPLDFMQYHREFDQKQEKGL